MTTTLKAAANRCATLLNPQELWRTFTRCDHPRTHREFVRHEAVRDSRGDYALITEVNVCNICGEPVGDAYTVVAN